MKVSRQSMQKKCIKRKEERGGRGREGERHTQTHRQTDRQTE